MDRGGGWSRDWLALRMHGVRKDFGRIQHASFDQLVIDTSFGGRTNMCSLICEARHEACVRDPVAERLNRGISGQR